MAIAVQVTRLNLSMNKSITLNLDGKTLVVKQLPLRRYAELLEAVQNLPKSIGGIDKLNNDEIFNQLPLLVSKALPDVLKMLTIATDLKQEEIDELGLADAIKIVVAIVEVNDYRGVYEQIKKAMARPAQAVQLKA